MKLRIVSACFLVPLLAALVLAADAAKVYPVPPPYEDSVDGKAGRMR